MALRPRSPLDDSWLFEDPMHLDLVDDELPPPGVAAAPAHEPPSDRVEHSAPATVTRSRSSRLVP